jgi:hypothetical protein
MKREALKGKTGVAGTQRSCRRGKKVIMKALNKWKRKRTCANRYELVETKRHYKEIMENEKKEW